MAGVGNGSTIRQYQDFVRDVYGRSNDLHFDLSDMMSNIERFAMCGLKGIRKKNDSKTRLNLLISISWFMSTMNRLHIDIESEIWRRFPYVCSYCTSCPCSCAETRPDERKAVSGEGKARPLTIKDFQSMFERIYPPERRTLDHAGVHLAEEIGEFSEAILAYRGEHRNELLRNVFLEAADVFSCYIGVFNSLGMSMADEISLMFSENCHECRKSPCECDFDTILNYSS